MSLFYRQKDIDELKEIHQNEIFTQEKKIKELEDNLQSCQEQLQELKAQQQKVSSLEATLLDRAQQLDSRERGIDIEANKLKEAIEKHYQEKAHFYAEINKNTNIIREQGLAELEKELQMLREQCEKEMTEALASSQNQYQMILQNANKCAEEIVQTAENQTKNMREQCIIDINNIHQQTNEEVENSRNDTKLESARIRQSSQDEAERLLQNAQVEARQIVARAQVEADELVEKGKVNITNLENEKAQLTENNARLAAANTRLKEKNQTLELEKQQLITECQIQRNNFEERLKQEKETFDQERSQYISTMDRFETLRVQLESHGKDVTGLTQELANMDIREQELNAKENDLNERDRILKFKEERNESIKQDLEERGNNLDQTVQDRYPEMLAAKEEEIERLKNATDELRSSLASQETIVTAFQNLQSQCGGENPAELLLNYQRVQNELTLVMEKIKNMPSYTLQTEAKELEEKREFLDNRERDIKKQEDELENIQAQNNSIQTKNNLLQTENENLKTDLKLLEDHLNRLRAAYEDPSTEEERIEKINEPFVIQECERDKTLQMDEIKWLDNIDKQIKEYGLEFPPRILHAFHTALKTSQMSPLTVLAGVSGTGKSQLPRLYSHFGGINFLGVPVQPNWDSQEAMLGYYNSIDNCFEPTNILRLLAQTQREPDKQNGLNDVMHMILLDEMNLANVELYFAEFLSKLETRRGCSDKNIPTLGVKIGAKQNDFQLKLGKNVLWTGTMNNDETTKTLSDKVLDRGIIINFPRPKELIRFKGNTLKEPSPLLPKEVWERWIDARYAFPENEINPYKETVEKINQELGKTGRALGHRVWQSIEYYMSLYPHVIAASDPESERKKAMDRAFEDQLVQKVMPKLRGLETTGTEGGILNSIEEIIPESLHTDFEHAKQGYGQFIWTTSEYLLQDK